MGTGLAIDDVAATVTAAFDGRIDSLFVATGEQQWGVFCEEQRTAEVHPERLVGDEDLLNVAAMYTFLRRGTVYALAPDQMPYHTSVAATLRY